MRKIIRSAAVPGILRGEEARAAKESIAEHYRLPPLERARRRAPLNPKLWVADDVRESLIEVFRSKCAYCEILLDSSQMASEVGHHRPTGGAVGMHSGTASPDHYSWFAYEWENLFLVCSACNRTKANRFPVEGPRAQLRCAWSEAESSERSLLINPCQRDPRRHIRFHLDGFASPKDDIGAYTIDTLDLNRRNLLEGRAATLQKCMALLDRGRGDPTAFDEIQHVMSDDAPFCGAIRIFFFELFSVAASEIKTARPLFRSIASDVVGVTASSDDAQWRKIVDLARGEPHEHSRPDYARAMEDAPRELRQVEPRSIAQLRKLTVKDFKGVAHLQLEIPPSDPSSGAEAPCMMLLGENSTGKSSTLQAIALTLMPPKMRKRMQVSPQDFVPREIAAWELNDTVTPEVRLEFDTGETISMRIDPLSKEFVSDRELPIVLFAFGSRRFFGKDVARRQATSPLKSLFDPFAKLQHPGQWLQSLSDDQFNALARAMREVLVLQGEDSIDRDEEGRLFVRAHGRNTPLERLSDGYRSLMAMVLDIMRGMLDVWGDLETARGLVLIDEIETHLHPRWKLRVMSALRRAMPHVQFIVTTHDPLCLRGMRGGEVQVLVRDSHHQIKPLSGLPDVRGLRAEQLLTSDYFGLSSTADPEIEEALQRRALPHRPNTAADAADRETLRRLQWIGDSPFEQVFNEALRRFINETSDDRQIDRALVRESAVNNVLETLRGLRLGRTQ